MIVLGCDPGLRNCGFAVIDWGAPVTLVGHAVAKPKPKLPMTERLWVIWEAAAELMERHRPKLVVIEDQAGVFAGKTERKQTNASTLYLRDVCGILYAEAFRAGADVILVTPQQAKIALFGKGGSRADKDQMVTRASRFTGQVLNEHEADAFAIALAGARRSSHPPNPQEEQ